MSETTLRKPASATSSTRCLISTAGSRTYRATKGPMRSTGAERLATALLDQLDETPRRNVRLLPDEAINEVTIPYSPEPSLRNRHLSWALQRPPALRSRLECARLCVPHMKEMLTNRMEPERALRYIDLSRALTVDKIADYNSSFCRLAMSLAEKIRRYLCKASDRHGMGSYLEIEPLPRCTGRTGKRTSDG